MFLAAEKGDINTIIGGIAPDWGPFGSLGSEARVMIEVVMAVALLLCFGIAIWGAAKQRIGATALRDTFSAEQGKGLIVMRPHRCVHHRITGHPLHDRVWHGHLAAPPPAPEPLPCAGRTPLAASPAPDSPYRPPTPYPRLLPDARSRSPR